MCILTLSHAINPYLHNLIPFFLISFTVSQICQVVLSLPTPGSVAWGPAANIQTEPPNLTTMFSLLPLDAS